MRALAAAGARLGVHPQRHERARPRRRAAARRSCGGRRGGDRRSAERGRRGDGRAAAARIRAPPVAGGARDDDRLRRGLQRRRTRRACRRAAWSSRPRRPRRRAATRSHRVRDGYDRLLQHLAAPLARVRGRAAPGDASSPTSAGRGAGVEVVVARRARRHAVAPARARRADHAAARRAAGAALGAGRGPVRARLAAPRSGARSGGWRWATSSRWCCACASRSAPACWRRSGRDMSFVHLGDAPVPTWWVPRPFPPTMLVGWIAGRRADAIRGAPPRRPRRAPARGAGRARARASGVDAAAVTAAVEDARVFDWGADPWARGAYSWIPVGGLDAPAALAAPVGGPVVLRGRSDRHRSAIPAPFTAR